MTPERWRQITAIFERAAARPPDERDSWLAQACGDDVGLRGEVEALLRADPQAEYWSARAVAAVAYPPALALGARLGAYEVVELVGSGGMGEVYRARDPRLRRDVAIKVLSIPGAGHADALARFEREARAVAALSHPNILAIHEFGSQDDLAYAVTELLDGETLRQRLARGPLPPRHVLGVATQIAQGLAAAHSAHITHRDLKPENIFLTANGTVKILDFGLAWAAVDSGAADSVVTRPGTVMGTVGYMSPEQVRGERTEATTDIFAFGCVLYEMLAGTAPFSRATAAETLAATLRDDPLPLADRVTDMPASLDALVAHCLEKRPQDRFQSAADMVFALRTASAPAASASLPPSRWRPVWLRSAVGLALVAGLAIGWMVRPGTSSSPSVIRAIWDVSPAEEVGTDSVLGVLPGGSRKALAWSPDGKTLAFVGLAAGVRRIYLRDLDKGARPLDGTENARSLAFSPDGQWIAFWTPAEGQGPIGPRGAIWKIRAAGGAPAKICDATLVYGMSWGTTHIVYSAMHQLFEVSPDGHDPQTLFQSAPYVSSPVLLPGETAVMYTEHDKLWTSGDERVVVKSLSGATAATVLLSRAADAQYLPTGHLAYLRQGTLYVAPFDAASLTLRGGEVPVLNDVAQSVTSWSGADLTLAGQFAISLQGTLAYLRGAPSLPVTEPVAVNRRGQVTPLGADPKTYREGLEPSPDGRSFTLEIQTPGSRRLYLYDRIRGTSTPLLAEASDRETFSPRWSADGRIALSVQQNGGDHLELFRPAAPGVPEVVSDSAGFVASSWSHDGERLVGIRDLNDLWVYLPKGPEWKQLTASPNIIEQFPAWSPDGRWLAYTSNTSGRNQVYVQRYPEPGRPIQVSTNRGIAPAWNSNGKELFYIEGRPFSDDTLQLMSVDMATPDLPGRPVRLFSYSARTLLFDWSSPSNGYSVARDGQTFFTLLMLPRQPARVTQIQVIFNWLEDVKRQLRPQ